MNINEFISSINSSGIAVASDYRCLITKSPTSVGEERDMVLRCDSVDFPGRIVNTIPVKYYGLPRQIAMDSVVNQVNASFIISEDLREKEYFEKWMDKIVGSYRLSSSTDNRFDLGFYDDYIGTVTLEKLDPVGNIIYTMKLTEAYPIAIGNLSMNWADGGYLRLPVSFAYRLYTDSEIDI